MSVCLSTGGTCVAGCVLGGLGACVAKGACMHGEKGHTWQRGGGMCGRGAFMAEGAYVA